jgi:hypothetical protein
LAAGTFAHVQVELGGTGQLQNHLKLDAHDGVVVEEAARVGTICTDSTHDRSQVN